MARRQPNLDAPPRARLRRRRRGFTLVEVLATLMLLAIVLPAILQGISLAMLAASKAKRQSEATSLAQWKLNDLVTTGNWAKGETEGDFGTDPQWAAYRWTAEYQNWSQGSVQELRLHVTWVVNNRQDEVVLSTLVYPNATSGLTTENTTGTGTTGTGGTGGTP